MKKDISLKGLLLFLVFLSVGFVSADLVQISHERLPGSLAECTGTEICCGLEEGSSFLIGSRVERTEAGDDLLRFYKESQCRPVWINDNGVNPQALYVIHAIQKGVDDGLDSNDPAYNLDSILYLMSMIKSDPAARSDPAILAQLDILLTDAYMMLGKHLYYGVLPREKASKYWTIAGKGPLDLPLRLRQALQDNNISESLGQLPPAYSGYRALKKKLMEYRRIQERGGWKTIAPFDRNNSAAAEYPVKDIKERLRMQGDLSGDENSSDAYADALVNFQKRHRIKADGNVSAETLAKLNIPVEERIKTIRLNMERWRWMPEKMEKSYISVNIPDFILTAVREGTPVLKMKVIVGRAGRPTPVFNASMKYIVVNPYWHVPSTILREDIFPKVRKNISYLKKERIRIFRYGDESGKNEIHPASIDWKNGNPKTFPYYLRQDPGPKNSLGRLKFMFPNSHDVYIHDTPYKYLFEKTTRSFSSGCIRIEDPIKFADYLLRDDGKVGNDKNITDLIASGVANKNIFLSKPLKVYINYWTVWEDDEGRLQFRDDVYGYDRGLAGMLNW